MHLQKCNIKIWNALAKVQSQDMELFPLVGSIAGRESILSSLCGLRRYFAEGHWLRGSVNSGIVYVPDSHPTPFCFFWGFGFWSIFGRSGSSSSMEALRFALLQHCTYNACITSEAGGGQDSHPRHRITITIAFRIPRILGEERATRNAPFT